MLPNGFKPMLSGKLEGGALRYPVYVSPKLDGIRAFVWDGIVWSRNLKPIPNRFIQKTFGRNTDLCKGLDGELIVGPPNHPNVFNASTSGVMSEDGMPAVIFHVFDHIEEHTRPFQYRLARMRGAITMRQIQHISEVPQTLVKNEDELMGIESEYVAAGYEGVMIRDPNGPYKYGRSTAREGWLLKLKRFADDEAEVVGWEEKLHNANEAKINALGHMERSSHKANKHGMGVLGALVVKHPKFGEFNIGTGFDDVTRGDLWNRRADLYGKLVKFRYQPHGVLDKPRFPVFVGFRDPRDV